MKYAFLGRSGLQVSRVSFGTATFGGRSSAGLIGKGIGEIELEEAQRIVGLCIDAGVNYFDTADAYAAGGAETIVGRALDSKRGDVLIGTKFSLRMGAGHHDHGASRRHVIAACEASLRRLGTDWIDLYQVHYPDGLVPIEE